MYRSKICFEFALDCVVLVVRQLCELVALHTAPALNCSGASVYQLPVKMSLSGTSSFHKNGFHYHCGCFGRLQACDGLSTSVTAEAFSTLHPDVVSRRALWPRERSSCSVSRKCKKPLLLELDFDYTPNGKSGSHDTANPWPFGIAMLVNGITTAPWALAALSRLCSCAFLHSLTSVCASQLVLLCWTRPWTVALYLVACAVLVVGAVACLGRERSCALIYSCMSICASLSVLLCGLWRCWVVCCRAVECSVMRASWAVSCAVSVCAVACLGRECSCALVYSTMSICASLSVLVCGLCRCGVLCRAGLCYVHVVLTCGSVCFVGAVACRGRKCSCASVYSSMGICASFLVLLRGCCVLASHVGSGVCCYVLTL
jgi:hypothetical protein